MGLAVGDKVIANHASCLYEEEAYSDLLGAQGKVSSIDRRTNHSDPDLHPLQVQWGEGIWNVYRLCDLEHEVILWD